MFDAMMGSYGYSLINSNNASMEKAHSFFLFFHIYIANIFLLNYLVAILSTVYSDMLEKGSFMFYCNKYQYIERYNIGFQDTYGYNELIVHPPPLNIMLVFLYPSIFQKDKMSRHSNLYSRVNFWFENIFSMIE